MCKFAELKYMYYLTWGYFNDVFNTRLPIIFIVLLRNAEIKLIFKNWNELFGALGLISWIANYSYTFEITQMDTDSIWKFMRFNTIREYCDRTPLPAPFCLISHFYLLLQQCSSKCCKQRSNQINSLSKS